MSKSYVIRQKALTAKSAFRENWDETFDLSLLLNNLRWFKNLKTDKLKKIFSFIVKELVFLIKMSVLQKRDKCRNVKDMQLSPFSWTTWQLAPFCRTVSNNLQNWNAHYSLNIHSPVVSFCQNVALSAIYEGLQLTHFAIFCS